MSRASDSNLIDIMAIMYCSALSQEKKIIKNLWKCSSAMDLHAVGNCYFVYIILTYRILEMKENKTQ